MIFSAIPGIRTAIALTSMFMTDEVVAERMARGRVLHLTVAIQTVAFRMGAGVLVVLSRTPIRMRGSQKT